MPHEKKYSVVAVCVEACESRSTHQERGGHRGRWRIQIGHQAREECCFPPIIIIVPPTHCGKNQNAKILLHPLGSEPAEVQKGKTTTCYRLHATSPDATRAGPCGLWLELWFIFYIKRCSHTKTTTNKNRPNIFTSPTMCRVGTRKFAGQCISLNLILGGREATLGSGASNSSLGTSLPSDIIHGGLEQAGQLVIANRARAVWVAPG